MDDVKTISEWVSKRIQNGGRRIKDFDYTLQHKKNNVSVIDKVMLTLQEMDFTFDVKEVGGWSSDLELKFKHKRWISAHCEIRMSYKGTYDRYGVNLGTSRVLVKALKAVGIPHKFDHWGSSSRPLTYDTRLDTMLFVYKTLYGENIND